MSILFPFSLPLQGRKIAPSPTEFDVEGLVSSVWPLKSFNSYLKFHLEIFLRVATEVA